MFVRELLCCTTYDSRVNASVLHIPTMGRQIKGNTQTLLTSSQVLAVEFVGLFDSTESGILHVAEEDNVCE